MQETQYGIKLVQEDVRWMFGEADLGNALAPFSASAVAPVSLEAASGPQVTLGATLATLSVDINALTQGQVRLRETLETLNSALSDPSRSIKAPAAEADSPLVQALKWAGEGLTDSARTKVSDKVIEGTLGKIPVVGELFKKDSKGNDACCTGISETLRGRERFAPRNTAAKKRARPSGLSTSKKTSGPSNKTTGFTATARKLGPLKYAAVAMDVIQGARNGDAKAIGTGLSTAGAAWAGASAGAAIGTMIFPGVGTAVGGAIGGLLGSEVGAWLGDKLFGSTDRLPAPGAVSKELNSARTDNAQITIAPNIQITGVNPADAQQVVNQVIQALQFQCMPMVTDSLGIRRNAALADSGGD